MNKKILIPLGYCLCAIFLLVAIYYFVTPADQLAHFVPGYSAKMTAPHFKHGIACLVLAVGCGLYCWFAAGPKKSNKEQQDAR